MRSKVRYLAYLFTILSWLPAAGSSGVPQEEQVVRPYIYEKDGTFFAHQGAESAPPIALAKIGPSLTPPPRCDISSTGKTAAYICNKWAADGDVVSWIVLTDLQTNKKKILRTGAVKAPYVSPDGSQLAFVDTQGGEQEEAKSYLYICSSDGSKLRRVSRADIDYFDGWADRWLVTHDQKNLTFYDSTNGRMHRLSLRAIGHPNPLGVSAFACSADLKTIVFSVEGSEPLSKPDMPSSALYCYDATRKSTRRLTAKGMYAIGPRWLDGTHVSFVGFHDDGKHEDPAMTYTIDISNGETKVLVKDGVIVASSVGLASHH